MSKEPNIDKIFKDSFDSFSPDVNSALWNNIANNIPKGPSSVVGTSAAKMSTGKIIAGAIGCILIGVTAVLVYQSFIDNYSVTNQLEQKQQVEKKLIPTQEKEILSDALTENTPFDKNDPVIQFSQKEIKQYDVALVEENNEHKEQTNSNQPQSIVNLFLTTKTRRLNNSDKESQSTINTPSIDTITKVEITQREDLVPIINASVSGGHSPLVVVFEQSENAELIKWDFGDGSTEIGTVVEHVFREPDTYTVTVLVESKGQTAQATKQITVNPRCIIQSIPNIFTPNGDGENDYFFIKGENIKSYFIQIFNLKGKVVFEADYIDAKWDGNDAVGNPLLPGQYLYFIKAIGNDQTDLSTTGSIVLRR